MLVSFCALNSSKSLVLLEASVTIRTYSFEGEENLLPKNMAFWHKDYFCLILFKTADIGEAMKV